MQLPLRITFRGMDSSPALEAAVRKNAERLERFHDRIVSCHVVIESPHHHQRKGALYDVRVDISVPGPDVIAHSLRDLHHAHEDVYVAMRDVFEAAARRLEDVVRRQRGRMKRHEAAPRGRIVRLFDDHGFFEAEELGDVYFHTNSVPNEKFKGLAVGDAVRYVLAEGESDKGAQASTVVRVARGRQHTKDEVRRSIG